MNEETILAGAAAAAPPQSWLSRTLVGATVATVWDLAEDQREPGLSEDLSNKIWILQRPVKLDLGSQRTCQIGLGFC